MKKKIWIILGIAVALIIIGVLSLTSFKKDDKATGEGQTQILTTEVSGGSVSVRVEGPSVVEPYRTQTIRSGIEGVILSGPVEGDLFKTGDLLVSFDSADKSRTVEQARIDLSQAVLNRDRASNNLMNVKTALEDKKKLFNSGAVAKDQVDAAVVGVSDAEYALSSAELSVSRASLSIDMAAQNLEDTTVKAPFDGVVLSCNLTNGDMIGKGAVLLTYADLSKIRLQAEVDEFDIGKVAVGMQVSVTSDTLGDKTLKSKVERISPAAEVINNIAVFKVSTVLKNSDGKLMPGMSADLSILISSDKGIIVPSKAVSSVRGRSYVKIYENEEVKTIKVTIGADDGKNVAVLEGLDEGTMVVVPGAVSFSLTGSVQGSGGTSVIPINLPGSGGK